MTNRIVESDSAVPEVKVCTAALRLMLQILNWEFSTSAFAAGVKQGIDSPKRSECNLVQVIASLK